jgi:hypothetical protein
MDVLSLCQVHAHTINPLALSVDELYGSCDATTHEWRDGVLARIMRSTCRWGRRAARRALPEVRL